MTSKNIFDIFKNKEYMNGIIDKIEKIAQKLNCEIKIMEVCGTHTMAISKYGIRSILPKNINLISGPGCPVCVTPNYYIKTALDLSRRDDVIITTFGDMMRIPFEGNSLLLEKARGQDIRIVYSPFDAVKIAKENKNKKVVFLSVGFETTIPVIALAVLGAFDEKVDNFYLFNSTKTIPNALKLISSSEELQINGFIYPGHVTSIIGTSLYSEILLKYKIPGIVTGFEAYDILVSIYNILSMIDKKDFDVNNEYKRVVSENGNEIAKDKIYNVFEECDSIWRGIGNIPASGLRLKKEYRQFDILENLGISENELLNVEEPKGCRCGEILLGRIKPHECKLFNKLCTPETPIGSCMVSSEGTCAAYHKYGI